jgi:hypothetical protein
MVCLLAVTLLAVVTAVSMASTIGQHLRTPFSDTSSPQSPSASLRVLEPR